MPTGYTAILHEKDLSASEFIMRCSRSMGALVTMRDEPLDAPIPEKFEPSSYYVKKEKELREELNRLRKMDDEEIEALGKEKFEKETKYHTEVIKEKEILLEKLNTLKKDTQGWDVYNCSEYKNLKDFTLDQLQIEIDDAIWSISYHQSEKKKVKLQDSTSLYTKMLGETLKDLDSCKKNIEEEVARLKGRNEWLANLRESLKSIK
jgi:hypothetical protein